MKVPFPERELQKAWDLFEEGALEKALKLLQKIEKKNPGLPDTAYQRALILERGPGESAKKEAKRLFAYAREKDPKNFPELLPLGASQLRKWAKEAMDSLPESIRCKLGNVPIFVEELPGNDDIKCPEDPLPPTLWGLFRGRILAENENMSQALNPMPPNIILYRRNLARYCENQEDLCREVKRTIWHEIGHFFGLDEADLKKLGLE